MAMGFGLQRRPWQNSLASHSVKDKEAEYEVAKSLLALRTLHREDSTPWTAVSELKQSCSQAGQRSVLGPALVFFIDHKSTRVQEENRTRV